MPSGLFIGASEKDLLKWRDEAQRDLGKAVMSYSDSGSSVSKQFGISPEKRLQEINYALSLLDPSRYGTMHTIVTKRWNWRRDS